MSNFEQPASHKCRYETNELYVTDTNKVINDGRPIYIREILDSSSTEFQNSKVSKEDRLNIIGSLGLKVLKPMLDECFKHKEGYSASNEMVFAIQALLSASFPQLNFLVVEDESKTGLSLKLPV